MDARFEQLLTSYAKNQGLSRGSIGMEQIENTLQNIINKRLEHPDCVLVALADVGGSLAVAQLAMIMARPCSRDECEKMVTETKTMAIDRSAKWLYREFAYEKFDTTEMLQQLSEKYFPITYRV